MKAAHMHFKFSVPKEETTTQRTEHFKQPISDGLTTGNLTHPVPFAELHQTR